MVDILGFMLEAVASVDCHRALRRKGEVASLARHIGMSDWRVVCAQHLAVESVGVDMLNGCW